MNKLLLSVLLFFTTLVLVAQVGIGTTNPDGSAVLEIRSTTKGFLPPRVADETTIATPATGLIIYNTTESCLQVNTGTPAVPNWQCMGVTEIPFTVPATITLAQDLNYSITSVYDDNYLPYTPPTGAASTASSSPDGTADTLVDVAGALNTVGVTVNIPVTATASGTLPAFSQTVTVPANLTENTQARDVTLSWVSQAYTASTTSITATLVAVASDLEVKQLDINEGIGNDNLGVLLASFTYPYNNAGNTTTYGLRGISGIPDRNFGNGTHDFLYVPVTNPTTGETWLNNNLGAHYSNLNHADFSPTTQAIASNDFKAYGSLIQWGRYSDGHELINWTSASGSDGAEQTRVTSTKSATTTVGHSDFILEPNLPYKWYTGANPDVLWQGVTGTNNVCPQGYRIPTEGELDAERLSWGTNNAAGAYNSPLALTLAGYHSSHIGTLINVGSNGEYWSSAVNGTNARNMATNTSNIIFNSTDRAYGFSVRCIQE